MSGDASHLESMAVPAWRHGKWERGAGFLHIESPEWPDRPVRIVLEYVSTEAEESAFADWLASRSGLAFHGFSRRGDERYAPE